MVARELLGCLSDWKLDPRVADELEGTGFPTLVKIAQILMSKKQHDNKMLDALIKRYDPATNSFKFGDKYMFFGLEDVLYLTGLKVEGKLLIKDKDSIEQIHPKIYHSRKQPDKVYIPGLGKVGKTLLLKSNRLSLKELTKFMSVPEDVRDIGPYVRAFCLYVLETVILSSQQHTSVSAFYLAALMDIKGIKDYAWGAMMLANLHYRLSTCASSDQKGVGGCMFFLMVWLFEHVPSLIQVYGSEEPEEPRPSRFPLSVEWADIVTQKLGKGSRKKQYERLLDELWDAENQKLTPRPYARLGTNFLPDVVREQKRMGMYFGILVHPIHSSHPPVFHRPEVWPEKLGFDVIDTNHCPDLLPDKRYSSWRKHIKQWELKCFVKGHNETHAATSLPRGLVLHESPLPSNSCDGGHNESTETSPHCSSILHESPLPSNSGGARAEASLHGMNDTFLDCYMEHNGGYAETSLPHSPIQHGSSLPSISGDDISGDGINEFAGTSPPLSDIELESPLRNWSTNVDISISSPRPVAETHLSELIGLDNVIQANVYCENLEKAKKIWAESGRYNALKRRRL